MNQAHAYEIRIQGHLSKKWADWLENLQICNHPNGETLLTGQLADQAALLGVLTKIHSLHLTLLSVKRLPLPAGSPH
jgi:hypothetical protein